MSKSRSRSQSQSQPHSRAQSPQAPSQSQAQPQSRPQAPAAAAAAGGAPAKGQEAAGHGPGAAPRGAEKPAAGDHPSSKKAGAKKPATSKPAAGKPADGGAAHEPVSFLMQLRGWVDALIIAYVLAMFIRTFVVELFKIPTGSMTPTLVGDEAASEYDYDGDGDLDLLLLRHDARTGRQDILHVFLREGDHYEGQLYVTGLPAETLAQLRASGRPRHDMILVNKFLYWFHPPRRGDIIVFKVPDRPELGRENPWNPDTPIYIKRCVGIPGDHVSIAPPAINGVVPWDLPAEDPAARIAPVLPGDPAHIGRLPGHEWHLQAGPARINGAPPSEPPVFARLQHYPGRFAPWNLRVEPQEITVPAGQVLMMGDNSSNSTDGRVWGSVPFENIKGKAIFRYWPLRKASFLE